MCTYQDPVNDYDIMYMCTYQDPKVREDEIFNWMTTLEEPEKLLMDFVDTNPMNINGEKYLCTFTCH